MPRLSTGVNYFKSNPLAPTVIARKAQMTKQSPYTTTRLPRRPSLSRREA